MNPALRHILHTAVVTAALALPALSQAHHSFAMYDMKVEKSFTGKLTRFVAGASHSQFIFDVLDDQGNPTLGADGKPLTWGVETGPAAGIAHQGITTESFPIGTIFTVTLSPLRDGRNAGTQMGGIVLCGMKMPAGGCTKYTGTVYMDKAHVAGPGPEPSAY